MISSFENCINLNTFIIKGFNTSEVQSMHKLFYNTDLYINLDLSDLNTSNVQDMSYMLSKTHLESIDLSNFNTEKVKNMLYLFANSSSLKNLDLSGFKTDNLIDMSFMFFHCKVIKEINLNNFNTENVLNMTNLFKNCLFYHL